MNTPAQVTYPHPRGTQTEVLCGAHHARVTAALAVLGIGSKTTYPAPGVPCGRCVDPRPRREVLEESQ